MLENYGFKPEKVFYYFEQISNIPRGSGNTKAVSDYCVNFAKERNLYVRQDEYNNVVIKKPATVGFEDKPAVIIQGHLDMVAQKDADSTHDFMKDPIELIVNGDFITANKTTLGADDGIAVAVGLALLDDSTINHPELEIIFTSDEETGMDGAMGLDMSDINGKYMLNLDSEDDGVITVGCAGGKSTNVKFNMESAEVAGVIYQIDVSGLKGGHSGAEIHNERANANIVLGRVLKYINDRIAIRITSLNGGDKDNVITKESKGIFVLHGHEEVEEKKAKLEGIFNEVVDIIKNEFAISDADLNISLSDGEYGIFYAASRKMTDNILAFMDVVPFGPQYRVSGMNGLVETSLNMGILKTKAGIVDISMSLRSSVKSRKNYIAEKIETLAKLTGGEFSSHGEYPEWTYKANSPLQKLLCDIYKEKYNEDLKVEIIHAGLECGYILEKKPDIDVVSFGPQMYDIHTTDERVSISSVTKLYDFVAAILGKIE